MKILVTGMDGYIGSVLAPYLANRGHEVSGLDTGFYRDAQLFDDPAMQLSRYRKDIRRITDEELSNCDAVVHLAELSNDPLGQLNPSITFQINHEGSVALAERCRRLGIERFVYTSSCSVYGASGGNGYRDETDDTDPQTAYAKCKVMVERDVGMLANDAFSPTFLRNATAYGAAPRMRFDLVLNDLSGLARTKSEIRLRSDGTPWRPLVHILDISQAIACVLEAPRDLVHAEVFNVGSTDQNYRVREVAKIVADVFPGCDLSIGSLDGDNRSYRVSFDKIHERLPDFRTCWTAVKGAEQLKEVFERIELSEELFGFRTFTRLRQLQHLLRTRQIDDNLYWRQP